MTALKASGARGLALALVAALVLAAPAGARHGDIHVRCQGDTPIITERPPGTDDVEVVCRSGVPEFIMKAPTVPVYRPADFPVTTPSDYAGWVLVWLNERPLKAPFNPARGLQEPGAFLTASSNRVLMPVRFFTEALGGQVEWVEASRHVGLTWQGKQILLQIGNETAYVDGQRIELDQAPTLFMDRTFVPVRFLLETFGAKVKWDKFGLSARIELEGASCINAVYCGEAR